GEVGARVLPQRRLEDLPVLEHLVVLHVSLGGAAHDELHARRGARALGELLGQLLALVEPLLRQELRHAPSSGVDRLRGSYRAAAASASAGGRVSGEPARARRRTGRPRGNECRRATGRVCSPPTDRGRAWPRAAGRTRTATAGRSGWRGRAAPRGGCP